MRFLSWSAYGCPHYGGQDINEEREQVDLSLNKLRELTGQDIIGWISPDRSESENTPELLVEHGVQYFCDWVKMICHINLRLRMET